MRPAATPTDRVGRGAALLTGAGVVLLALGGMGVIAAAAGSDWALLTLGVLAVVVGGLVTSVGLGLRRLLAQAEHRAAGVRIDAEAAAIVGAESSDRPRDCVTGGIGEAGAVGAASGTEPATGVPGADRRCGDECGSICALAGRTEPRSRLNR